MNNNDSVLDSLRENDDFILYYCSHYNWHWVIADALENYSSRVVHCKSYRDLPSQKASKAPRRYSLFNVELFSTINKKWYGAWCISPGFEFLDAKDALYKQFLKYRFQSVMPRTSLISWDSSNEDDIGDLPSIPALLKAALGSGGYGIYYVYNKSDALRIIKNHAKKALSVPDFHKKLIETYHQVPDWSLQDIIPSTLINNDQKCQIRAYIVLCNRHLYLYQTFEIRIPHWREIDAFSDIDLSSHEADFFSFEDEIPTDIHNRSRPYNYGRVKTSTQRHLLSEFEELRDKTGILTDMLVKAFSALEQCILENTPPAMPFELKPLSLSSWSVNDVHDDFMHESITNHLNTVAIAGIDIMLHRDTNVPYIVEINNNPAMPTKGKNMSQEYALHLPLLLRNILNLSVTTAALNHSTLMADKYNFIQIW